MEIEGQSQGRKRNIDLEESPFGRMHKMEEPNLSCVSLDLFRVRSPPKEDFINCLEKRNNLFELNDKLDELIEDLR